MLRSLALAQDTKKCTSSLLQDPQLPGRATEGCHGRPSPPDIVHGDRGHQPWGRGHRPRGPRTSSMAPRTSSMGPRTSSMNVESWIRGHHPRMLNLGCGAGTADDGGASRKKARRDLDPQMANGWTPPRRATPSRPALQHCGGPKPNLLYCAPRGRRRRFLENHSKTPQNCHFRAGSGCNSPLDACSTFASPFI